MSNSRRGQIKMSFGMIFSMILIAVFIAFAFFAIQKFVSLQGSINTKQFVNNLQTDVTSVYTSQQASQPESYTVPRSVVQVCFESGVTDNNLLFITNKGIPMNGGYIDHLNMTAMMPGGANLCFNATNNKVSFTLQKNFENTLVTIH